jgi:hypothetical protein
MKDELEKTVLCSTLLRKAGKNMNIEQYKASMDPELRAGFIQMLPYFSNRPSDLIEARKFIEEMLAAAISRHRATKLLLMKWYGLGPRR